MKEGKNEKKKKKKIRTLASRRSMFNPKSAADGELCALVHVCCPFRFTHKLGRKTGFCAVQDSGRRQPASSLGYRQRPVTVPHRCSLLKHVLSGFLGQEQLQALSSLGAPSCIMLFPSTFLAKGCLYCSQLPVAFEVETRLICWISFLFYFTFYRF